MDEDENISEADNTLFIDYVNVQGFLGQFDIHLTLWRNTNFLIGVNGTGKTTLINIIRASLECNSRTLAGLPFDQVEIGFKVPHAPNRPQFIINKSLDAASEPAIRYRFKEQRKDKGFIDVMENIENRYFHLHLLGDQSKTNRSVDEIKSRLPSVSWLSVYREGTSTRPNEELSNPIDRKINKIIIDLTKYLSSLDIHYAKRLEVFQQNYFLSLVNARFSSIDEIFEYDLEQERLNITEILEELFPDANVYKRSIKNHFARARKSAEAARKSDALEFNDFLSISDTVRLHKLIQRWDNLQSERNKIYSLKDKFTEIMNKLLVNKSFSFNSRNQPQFESSDRIIPWKSLSSGEKQIFIILGITLLQESSHHIFLADEPELSLHIEWQRSLVENIRNLNPYSQIVFATHSPDVVAGFSDTILSMEKLLDSEQS